MICSMQVYIIESDINSCMIFSMHGSGFHCLLESQELHYYNYHSEVQLHAHLVPVHWITLNAH